MATKVPTATFLSELEKHNLLEAGQLREAREHQAASSADPKALAAELIQRGWLTPFQVNRVLSNNVMLGPYVLLDRLGQGGMGQVFKARHTLMNRVVALKVIRGDHLDKPECLARFHREMQAAAKLAHPNVVLAHDAARAGSEYYLAMEYVEGADLARIVSRRGKLPPAEACAYIRQAAQGLQHACERGLVHRDIKPSNLILATQGSVVKILDMGLARLRMDLEIDAAATGLTPEGSVMGTPDYLAPEQAIDARNADIRADIYSLGCTLYHLLTGAPPFRGGSITEKLLRHQRDEPEPLERRCPEASAELVRIVQRMMAKRPEDRYQTPREVAEALAPLAGTYAEPETALMEVESAEVSTETADMRAAVTRTMPPEERPKPPRRVPVLLLVALAACMAFVAALVIGVPLVVLLFLMPASVPDARTKAEPPPEVGVKHDDMGDPVPVEPNARDGPVLNPNPKEGGKPKPKDGSKVNPVPVGPPGKAPAEVDNLAKIVAEGPAKLIADLTGHTGTVQCFAFSADGKRLASGADDRQTRLWNALTGEDQGPPLKHTDAVRALAFSRDGTQLASASWGGAYDGSVKLYDLAGDAKPITLPWKDKTGTPTRAQVNGLAFSADGKMLAAGGGPVRVWDLAKNGDPLTFDWQKTFPSYIYSVAFSPDGKMVAAGCHEQGDSVRVWTVGPPDDPMLLQGKAQAFGLSHSDVRGVVAYVAGGKLLVRVTSDGAGGFQAPAGSVKLWDVDAGKQKITLRDSHNIPGGGVFALASDAQGHLRVASAAGPAALGGLAPKSANGTVQIWDEATGNVRTFETGHKQNVTALAFSPDGGRLVTGSVDQVAKLWDLTK